LENMKNASQIADKQSQEIKELSAKLSAIQTTAAINQIALESEASAVAAATENMHSGQINRVFSPRSTDSRNERNRDACNGREANKCAHHHREIGGITERDKQRVQLLSSIKPCAESVV
jgi:hypothetical protein